MTGARVHLVTGAGSGIGAAICRKLAAPGVALAIHTGSQRGRAQAVADACASQGADCHVLVGDFLDPATAARLVAETEARFGGLDALVSNAGFADRRQLGELDQAGFDRSLAVILQSLFRLASAAQPLLMR